MANKDLSMEQSQDIKSLKMQEGESDKSSIKFYILSLITAIFVMVAVPVGAFYIAVSYNIKGIRDTYKDEIKKIPIINMALEKETLPDDPEKLTHDELKEYYTKVKKERDELLKEKERGDKFEKELEETKDELEKLKSENAKLDSESKIVQENTAKKEDELNKLKEEIDKLITTGDKEGFKEYFEKVNSEVAKEVYESLTKDALDDEEAKKFASTYEEMDAAAAAAIFETLGTEKLKLITDILKYMKKENTAEILSAMEPALAATITDKLAKDYLYKLE